MKTKTQYQPISVSLPKNILKKIDVIANESYKSRSEIIRDALIKRVIPTYEPTKQESAILARAQKDIDKGNATNWDDFVNKELK